MRNLFGESFLVWIKVERWVSGLFNECGWSSLMVVSRVCIVVPIGRLNSLERLRVVLHVMAPVGLCLEGRGCSGGWG